MMVGVHTHALNRRPHGSMR